MMLNREAKSERPIGRLFRIMETTSKALCFLGVALTLGGCVWAKVGTPDPAPIEFPLGVGRNVAADSQGRIYVAVGFYARVQRYSPDGAFELGWTVPTSGFFALRTTPDDKVQVASARGNELLTYSADGQLISEASHDGSLPQVFASETDTTGHYAMRAGLFPHIVDTATGQTIISTPWWKRLLAAPFPAFAYTLLGLVLFNVSELVQRCRRARTS